MKSLKPVLLATAVMMSGAVMAQPVVLINTFEVPAEKEEATLLQWEQTKEFLSKQPGYRSTRLHQALSPGRFTFINVAEWDSPEAFQQAIKAMQEEGLGHPLDGVKISPALYQVIRD